MDAIGKRTWTLIVFTTLVLVFTAIAWGRQVAGYGLPFEDQVVVVIDGVSREEIGHALTGDLYEGATQLRNDMEARNSELAEASRDLPGWELGDE